MIGDDGKGSCMSLAWWQTALHLVLRRQSQVGLYEHSAIQDNIVRPSLKKNKTPQATATK